MGNNFDIVIKYAKIVGFTLLAFVVLNIPAMFGLEYPPLVNVAIGACSIVLGLVLYSRHLRKKEDLEQEEE